MSKDNIHVHVSDSVPKPLKKFLTAVSKGEVNPLDYGHSEPGAPKGGNIFVVDSKKLEEDFGDDD